MLSTSRRSLSVLVVAAALLVWTIPVRAAQTDPAAFVDGLVQEALTILRNPQMPDAQREVRFNTLLRSGFDIPRIARFVLGRYWVSASDQERAQFGELFAQWVVRTYSARFKSYSGEIIKVTGARAESPTSYVVSSQLIHTNGAPPTTIYWHVNKSGDDLKIIDVEVEGVSMALTEREEIASVIQRDGGTVTGLNQQLQQRLDSGPVPASGSLAPAQAQQSK
ncbi:MAG: ABC transporter substrate-binding protein [Alphaproteobacteria bacterium]|nr:ABC transporter substrate-binding protein [Alphaproteobacteria bacterium]MDE2512578.1 ABC transporter substrate-binding protein [Alphaproteobacteria bacterium]